MLNNLSQNCNQQLTIDQSL